MRNVCAKLSAFRPTDSVQEVSEVRSQLVVFVLFLFIEVPLLSVWPVTQHKSQVRRQSKLCFYLFEIELMLFYSCLLYWHSWASPLYFRYCEIHGKHVFQALERFLPLMSRTGFQLVPKRESNSYRNICTSRCFKGNLKYCKTFSKPKSPGSTWGLLVTCKCMDDTDFQINFQVVVYIVYIKIVL